jgi:O-antigen/teichoic acid export membrane protein
LKEGIRRIAVTGFLWTFFQKVGGQVISFVVFVVLARLLSPDDFGLVAMANVSIAFLTLFTGAALTAALVQRAEIDASHLDTMFWTVVGLSILLAVGTWQFAAEIAEFFKEPDLEPILSWLVVCLPLSALQQVQISLLRRELNFRSIALRLLISQPIAGAIGISFALLGFGVWSLVARTIASAVIQTLVLWFTVNWRPRFSFSIPHFRDLFSFGINVSGANFVAFFSRRMDVFLIGYVLGAGQLGIYTVAKRLILLLVELIGGTIEHVAWPIFSRIQQDRRKVVEAFHKATHYVSLMAFPVFTGIAILAGSIVPVVFGDQWILSAQLMPVLACIGLVQAVLTFHETLMVGMGRPELKLRLQVMLAIANLIAFFVAIEFGLLAVTIAYAIVAVALAPVWIIAVRTVVSLDIKRYLMNYVSAIIATSVMALCIFIASSIFHLDRATPVGLAANVFIGFLAYCLVIVALERETIVDFAKSVFVRRESRE